MICRMCGKEIDTTRVFVRFQDRHYHEECYTKNCFEDHGVRIRPGEGEILPDHSGVGSHYLRRWGSLASDSSATTSVWTVQYSNNPETTTPF